MALPKFPTTVIGSWPRSVEVQKAMRDKSAKNEFLGQLDQIFFFQALFCSILQKHKYIFLISDRSI